MYAVFGFAHASKNLAKLCPTIRMDVPVGRWKEKKNASKNKIGAGSQDYVFFTHTQYGCHLHC